ncbi:MAG: hypothetical protein CMF62_02865 [Magnetococcales bacterium]|nr:hypothetical protein [Magnetococcales bacterium]|tara:strand:- start:15062 stop:15484 length:423 start_codon:yes stop_codon:yes gene_type:complete
MKFQFGKPCQTTQIVSNTRAFYKDIAKQFCNEYYYAYDTEFKSLLKFYNNKSVFTFCEEEFLNFETLNNRLVNYYMVNSFKHDINKIDAQPVGEKGILITIVGTVKVNNLHHDQDFVETILLEENKDNVMFVINTIFRVF